MSDETTVRNVITSIDQHVRDVFGTSKAYHIDIYQREYRWDKDNVDTLLNDLQIRFEQHQRLETDPKEIYKDVLKRFEPYFLNTYLTHSTNSTTAIVDGQQRLTTILLMLIKLRSILAEIEVGENASTKTFSSKSLERLIFETDDFGDASRFKVYNENREAAFRGLIDNALVNPCDETQNRINENYTFVSQQFDVYFKIDGDSKQEWDLSKLTHYIFFLLDRVSIVEIKIERQQHVATIFEVVNDRGLGLKPYEILKGKLLGNLPPVEKEHANKVWTDLQNRYFASDVKNSTDSKITLDMFFQTYFRAKFAESEADYVKYENDYHYEIYRNKDISKYFGNFSDTRILYDKIVNEIKYFAELYLDLRTGYFDEFLIYNKLLDQNQQYLLIMSSVILNDPSRDTKVTGIARKFDQLHSVLRLLDVYDSNVFQRYIYKLNRRIRNVSMLDAIHVFDSTLIEALVESETIAPDDVNNVADIFQYERFRAIRNRWTNFSKYVLLRVDRYLAEHLDKPSYTTLGSLQDLEDHFNKSTRKIYGMHLEHIYARNEKNFDQFRDVNGIFDEQHFNTVRNQLGLVLLLKDRQNESSNNESYRMKMERYRTSNFIWNELMVGHLDIVDKRKVPDNFAFERVDPDSSGAFPSDKWGARQQLMYNAVKTVWLDDVMNWEQALNV